MNAKSQGTWPFCTNCDADISGSDTPKAWHPYCSPECRVEYEARTARIVAEDPDAGPRAVPVSDAEGGVLGWQPDANQRAWIMAEATRLGVTSADVLGGALRFLRAHVAAQRKISVPMARQPDGSLAGSVVVPEGVTDAEFTLVNEKLQP